MQEPGIGAAEEPPPSAATHRLFGYAAEDLKYVIGPMAEAGKEATWSMGDDTPVPPLARTPAPLYAFLTDKKTNPDFAGPIRWNFDKFLVGRDGKVIARFEPKTRPDAKQVLEAIAEALKQPVPDDAEVVRASHAPKEEKKEKAE